MRNNFSKFAFSAGFMLAMAFTFSCSGGGGGGGGGGDDDVSSSSAENVVVSSSSVNNVTSSSSVAPTECASYDHATQLCDSRDGKLYKFTVIGTGTTAQTWMAENLNFNASGSKCGDEATRKLKDENTSTCTTYGRLYDWSTAMGGSASSVASPSGVRGVCPAGWHLPSDEEWDALMTAVGGKETAGTKLKSASLWDPNDGTPIGTDTYGFSALPGGYGDSEKGKFGNVGGGLWWSATEYNGATEYNANYAYGRIMDYSSERVGRSDHYKSLLQSVRCLQD